MSYELVFTSLPKGLKPGSRGFSAVAFTEGMPANHVQFCESISGYVHLFAPHDPQYATNPTGFSHLLPTLGGVTLSVLSRVASYGTDYTGRTNKLAHHVMVSAAERTICGPAVLMGSGGLFVDDWTRPPCFLPQNRIALQDQEIASYRAMTWQRLLGDAGYAGMLAQAFLDAPSKPCFILFEPGMDLLPLLAEAQALLPEHRRWDVTFSTYFTTLPVGIECSWRCCLPDSDALKVARRTPNALVFDLPNRRVEGREPTVQALADVARTGTRIASASNITPNRPIVQVRSVPRQRESIERSRSTQQPRYRELASMPSDRAAVPPAAPPSVRARRPLYGWVGLCVAVIMVLLAICYAKIWTVNKKRSSQASQGTNTPSNVTTATNESPQATDGLQDLGKRSPLPIDPDTPTNPRPDSAVIRNPDEKVAPQAAVPVVKRVETTLSVERKLSIEREPAAGIPLPEGAKVTFYYVEGARVEHKRKQNLAGEKGATLYDNKSYLAREYDNRLTQCDASIGQVEVASLSQGTLYVRKPLSATVTCRTLFQEYEIHMNQTEADNLFRSYFSHELCRKVTARGKVSCLPAESVTMSISEAEETDGSVLIARVIGSNPWTAHKDQVSAELDGVRQRQNCITNAMQVLGERVTNIQDSRKELESHLMKPSADVVGKNMKALREAITRGIKDCSSMRTNGVVSKVCESSKWGDLKKWLEKEQRYALDNVKGEQADEIRKNIKKAYEGDSVELEWMAVNEFIDDNRRLSEFAVHAEGLLSNCKLLLVQPAHESNAQVIWRTKELDGIRLASMSIKLSLSDVLLIEGSEKRR
jgi:hypothetical protein